MKTPIKAAVVPGQAGIAHRRQHGVVLLIALIMLVAMSMAGLAMMRGVGAGLGIAGNLAFKQTATAAADLGIENARNWLTDPARSAANFTSNNAAVGYYATWDPDFSPATFNWEANALQVTSDDGAGNEVRVIVHRLCEKADLLPTDANQKCATRTTESAGGSVGGGGYGSTGNVPVVQPFYQVTARVRGPRNTISYTQVIMY